MRQEAGVLPLKRGTRLTPCISVGAEARSFQEGLGKVQVGDDVLVYAALGFL